MSPILPRLTQEEFEKRTEEKWPNKYDFSQAVYKNGRTPVTLICKKHGKPFEIKPRSLLSVNYECCPLCQEEADSKINLDAKKKKPLIRKRQGGKGHKNSRLTLETFILRSEDMWPGRYDYSLVEYKNTRTPVKLICKKHNMPFEQTPKAHFITKHECCPLCYKEKAGVIRKKYLKVNPPTQKAPRLPSADAINMLNKVFSANTAMAQL